MRFLKDMKIGLKLKLSFAILSVFIIIVGSVGVYGMGKINASTKNMFKLNLVEVKDISRIKANVMDINLKMLQLINEKDKVNIKTLENSIEKLKTEDDILLDEYNKTIKTSGGRKMFEDFAKVLINYREKRKNLLAYIDRGEYSSALSYYPKLDAVNNEIVGFLDKYIIYNEKSAQVNYENSTKLYKASLILVVVLVLLVILFGTFISFAISSVISKQINKLLIFARQIVKGDLEQPIDIVSNDELGGLGKELNKAALARKEYELSLEKNYQELEASHEEITALEEELREKYNELSLSEENLRKSEEWYKLIAEASSDALMDWDIKMNKKYYSNSWYKVLGYEIGSEKIEKEWEDIIHPEDYDKVKNIIKEHWENKSLYYEVEYRIKNKEGQYIWMSSVGKTLFDRDGDPYRLACSNKDITEVKEYEEKLEYIAYHDYLTGLPNRQYLYNKFKNDFIDKNDSLMEGAILFIDLDNFKFINDTMGHGTGDDLIIATGKRLKAMKNKDNFLVRLGGDEFIFGIKNVNNLKEIELFAKAILKRLSSPFEIKENKLQITASIGIAMFPKDGLTIDELLKKADIAMYQSKYGRKNRFTFFNDDMNKGILERMRIEKYLRTALVNNEFLLYYQPQVEISSGRITSFEALIRWNSPKLGFVSPNDFIMIAEENQMIIEIGAWVMKTACQFIKELNDTQENNCYISVNVSVLQFLQSDFIDSVFKVLEETKLEPQYLELEITESIYIENYEVICKKLIEFREKGIKIALDDFGKGYSSLSYLKELPIDTLKIDKIFIDSICEDEQKSLVDNIIKMGHKMELNIIAEGVETKEQHEYLKVCKCNKIQGYFFSRPVPKEVAMKLIYENFDIVS